jgi:hypothetical protein
MSVLRSRVGVDGGHLPPDVITTEFGFPEDGSIPISMLGVYCPACAKQFGLPLESGRFDVPLEGEIPEPAERFLDLNRIVCGKCLRELLPAK